MLVKATVRLLAKELQLLVDPRELLLENLSSDDPLVFPLAAQ